MDNKRPIPRLSKGKTVTIRVPESLLVAVGASREELQAEGLEKWGDCSEIIPGKLYLGSVFNGRDPNTLCRHQITAVVNVAEEFEYGSFVEYQKEGNSETVRALVHRIIVPDSINMNPVAESNGQDQEILCDELLSRLSRIFQIIGE